MAKILFILVTLTVGVFAEPPVGQQNGQNPSSQYGPPSGVSNGFSGQFGSPSGQNGAPGAERLPQNGRFSGNHGGSHQAGVYPFSGYDGAGNGLNGEENSEPANYEFQYDVEDQEKELKFGHKENRQGDVASGYYYVLLPDGRTQHVEYQADQDGYKPKISYEEAQGGYARGGPGGAGNGYSNGGHDGASQRNGGYQFRK